MTSRARKQEQRKPGPRVETEQLKDLDPPGSEQADRVRGGAVERMPQGSHRHTCFACAIGK